MRAIKTDIKCKDRSFSAAAVSNEREEGKY